MILRPHGIRFSREYTWIYVYCSGLGLMLEPVRNRLSRLAKGLVEKGKRESDTSRPETTSTSGQEESKDAERNRGGKTPIKKESIPVRPIRNR